MWRGGRGLKGIGQQLTVRNSGKFKGTISQKGSCHTGQQHLLSLLLWSRASQPNPKATTERILTLGKNWNNAHVLPEIFIYLKEGEWEGVQLRW